MILKKMKFDNPEIFSSIIHKDDRGYFSEIQNYKNKKVKKFKFIQDNVSYSKKGTLRGLHFQQKHPQTKFITVIHGNIYDVAIDLRSKSKYFGQVFKYKMSSKKNNQLVIPSGFAHGFQCTSEIAIILYKCDESYYPNDQHGINYNDKFFNIKWPISKKIISKKDKALPNFDINKIYYK